MGEVRRMAVLYRSSIPDDDLGKVQVVALKIAADGLAPHLKGDDRYNWERPHSIG